MNSASDTLAYIGFNPLPVTRIVSDFLHAGQMGKRPPSVFTLASASCRLLSSSACSFSASLRLVISHAIVEEPSICPSLFFMSEMGLGILTRFFSYHVLKLNKSIKTRYSWRLQPYIKSIRSPSARRALPVVAECIVNALLKQNLQFFYSASMTPKFFPHLSPSMFNGCQRP